MAGYLFWCSKFQWKFFGVDCAEVFNNVRWMEELEQFMPLLKTILILSFSSSSFHSDEEGGLYGLTSNIIYGGVGDVHKCFHSRQMSPRHCRRLRRRRYHYRYHLPSPAVEFLYTILKLGREQISIQKEKNNFEMRQNIFNNQIKCLCI